MVTFAVAKPTVSTPTSYPFDLMQMSAVKVPTLDSILMIPMAWVLKTSTSIDQGLGPTECLFTIIPKPVPRPSQLPM